MGSGFWYLRVFYAIFWFTIAVVIKGLPKILSLNYDGFTKWQMALRSKCQTCSYGRKCK